MSAPTKRQEIGRLALRVEGDWWVAYWSPHQHDMDKAVRLGSVRMNLVEDGGEIKARFMDLMRAAFERVVQDTFGITPDWQAPKPAPENERAGRA